MRSKKAFFVFFVFILSFLVLSSPTWATFVTMATFDINGDGKDEIIRTEGVAGETTVKIYESIEKSYFFKPVEELKISGNLVQVPDVLDVTGDALLDLYFATGSDIGVIYYDTVSDQYKRENEIAGQPQEQSRFVQKANEKRLLLQDAESDLYMNLEKEGPDDAKMDSSKDFYKGSRY